MFTATHRFVRNALFCAALAGLAALPASATETQEQVVRFTQSDLANDAQVAVLYGRLQTAARGVCSSHRGRDVTSMKNYRACYSDALEGAVNTVNEQTLTALHNAPAARSAKAARARADKQS
jgi:UrcA family protein